MKAINLDTYSLSLLTAKEDILNPRSSINWALFNYDGATSNLKLSDSGAGGLSELMGKFHASRPLYGLCRMAPLESGQRRIVLIAWVGEGVGERRREECSSHIPAVRAFFKEANAFITANTLDDVKEEKINIIVSKNRAPPEPLKRSPRAVEKEETVGTNYRKTNAAMEMHRINRESFWARAEREEEKRKEEERRRAAEDRRRLERERVLQERREAEERDRKMEEKLQLIEEQRKLQAKQEAEMRRQEKAKWEQQQKEHEEDMRARFRRRESIEKAAEAAALVSQRSMNPREFFRQLSSSSSTDPGSPRSVKPPFRRYQRSLTDTAFIFGRAVTPSSPSNSPLGSPFDCSPTSPLMSPTSPTFLPSTSPRRFPPASPLPKPTRPSAPSQPVPLSPTERFVSPAPPQEAAAAPCPEISAVPPVETSDVYVATRMLSDLEPEASLTAQAELVDISVALVNEGEKQQLQGVRVEAKIVCDEEEGSPALSSRLPNSAPQPEGLNTDPNLSVEGTVAAVLVMAVETPDEADPGKEEESAVIDWEVEGKADSKARVCAAVLAEHAEEEEAPAGHSVKTEKAVSVMDAIQSMSPVEAVPPTNGMSSEEDGMLPPEQNGTEQSLTPSDTDQSPCILRHDGKRDDFITENTENGEEVPLDEQLCVRALYNYHAEDESELSLEPGDIISSVETVDKAWFRGCSKDGRQGLFPANYVETI